MTDSIFIGGGGEGYGVPQNMLLGLANRQTEAEKQALLGDLKMEVEKLEDEGKDIEEDIFAISKRVK